MKTQIIIAWAAIFIAASANAQDKNKAAQAQDKNKAVQAQNDPATYCKPAEFKIGTKVIAPESDRFTATVEELPITFIQAARGSGFEPNCFRNLFRPVAGAPDDVLLIPAGEWFSFRTFKDGFYNGADVRVYRIRDGKWTKVRETKVAEYTSSGWMPIDPLRYFYKGKEFAVAEPGSTHAEWKMPGEAKRNIPYYFVVTAVSKDATESPVSNVATITPGDEIKGKNTPAKAPATVKVKSPNPFLKKDEALPAPKNLKAVYDDGGMVALDWEAPGGEIAGYNVYFCDVAPEQQKGFHFYLADKAKSPEEEIKENDFVFVDILKYGFSREKSLKSHIFKSSEYRSGAPMVDPYPDENPKALWELAPHAGGLPPELNDGAQTYLKVTLKDGGDMKILSYPHGGSGQDYYPVLEAGAEYVFDVWLKYEGSGKPEATFAMQGVTPKPTAIFTPTAEWKKYSIVFKQEQMDATKNANRMDLKIAGDGVWSVENFRFYPKKEGFLQASELAKQRLRESGMGAIRFHQHIKSGWSYTMEMLTGAPGAMGARGSSTGNKPETLSVLLNFVKDSKTAPWLQTEMCMSEKEWLGLVEYLAAPYDPAKDSPQTKPWAAKRHAQGHPAPWTDDFPTIYFEVANETWNGMFAPWVFAWEVRPVDEKTGYKYDYGEEYGVLNEFVIQLVKSSPYWNPELEKKFQFVLGGRNFSDYGEKAAKFSPSSKFVTIADYNGGWDAGEGAAKLDEESLFRGLTFWPQNSPHSEKFRKNLEKVSQAGTAKYYPGTYEAGPGYALPGLNGAVISKEQIIDQDQVGKSLACGVGTFDSFLGKSIMGFTLQNFFKFQFHRNYFTSHAPEYKGGHAYPSWLGLEIFNKHGFGEFVEVEMVSGPTWNVAKYARRQMIDNMPLVGVYATRKDDRLSVFLLSRKMDKMVKENEDGFTPVNLNLPFASASKVSLYKMTGDPRWHNLDEEKVKIQEKIGIPFSAPFVLNPATTGEAKDGLPPSSVFCYVFEGIK